MSTGCKVTADWKVGVAVLSQEDSIFKGIYFHKCWDTVFLSDQNPFWSSLHYKILF